MPEPEVTSVVTTVADHVAHVRLSRPSVHNAINGAVMNGLIVAAREIGRDRSIRAVVLSGEGRSFCSGLDVANFGAMADGSLAADSTSVQAAYQDISPGGANRAQQMGWLWQELEVPVIAAVHGVAMGGGLNLALAADLRVVAPDARLAFVEITWGLMPDMSASQSLRRLVSADRAKALVLTGQRFSGVEAYEWGLATELADDPLARATAIACTIAGHNPDAVRAALAVINHGADADTSAGLAMEAQRSASLLGTPNQVEAVLARFEDRHPVFGDPA